MKIWAALHREIGIWVWALSRWIVLGDKCRDSIYQAGIRRTMTWHDLAMATSSCRCRGERHWWARAVDTIFTWRNLAAKCGKEYQRSRWWHWWCFNCHGIFQDTMIRYRTVIYGQLTASPTMKSLDFRIFAADFAWAKYWLRLISILSMVAYAASLRASIHLLSSALIYIIKQFNYFMACVASYIARPAEYMIQDGCEMPLYSRRRRFLADRLRAESPSPPLIRGSRILVLIKRI